MTDLNLNEHDQRTHSVAQLRMILRYSLAALALVSAGFLCCESLPEPDVDVEAITDAAYTKGRADGLGRCVP